MSGACGQDPLAVSYPSITRQVLVHQDRSGLAHLIANDQVAALGYRLRADHRPMLFSFRSPCTA